MLIAKLSSNVNNTANPLLFTYRIIGACSHDTYNPPLSHNCGEFARMISELVDVCSEITRLLTRGSFSVYNPSIKRKSTSSKFVWRCMLLKIKATITPADYYTLS
ncbi:hypothetical protein CDAR_224901 [Caerostris darwini]|uniref:Uncharacterized protein n=1 Tax=Caerostris darwini TaxID=1538125 RepID=A0AAV4NCC9_9ARAC|nr:hypothetical protein CDAR_224901 [Caerostris darwini]